MVINNIDTHLYLDIKYKLEKLNPVESYSKKRIDFTIDSKIGKIIFSLDFEDQIILFSFADIEFARSQKLYSDCTSITVDNDVLSWVDGKIGEIIFYV